MNFIKYAAIITLSLSLQNAFALKTTCYSSQEPELGMIEVETFSTQFGERARIKNNGDESFLPCNTDEFGGFICTVFILGPALQEVEKFQISVTGEMSYTKSAHGMSSDGQQVNYEHIYTCEKTAIL